MTEPCKDQHFSPLCSASYLSNDCSCIFDEEFLFHQSWWWGQIISPHHPNHPHATGHHARRSLEVECMNSISHWAINKCLVKRRKICFREEKNSRPLIGPWQVVNWFPKVLSYGHSPLIDWLIDWSLGPPENSGQWVNWGKFYPPPLYKSPFGVRDPQRVIYGGHNKGGYFAVPLASKFSQVSYMVGSYKGGW